MSLVTCLGSNTLSSPGNGGGGHLWVYLNWALGLRALGVRVIWLEWVPPDIPARDLEERIKALRASLAPYELAESVALCFWNPELSHLRAATGCQGVEEAIQADLLVNLSYVGIPPDVVARFQRSAFVDIDPGLTQIWISECGMKVPRHDCYFTIGETVGKPSAKFPVCDLQWHYVPPPVFLPEWPVMRAKPTAPFSTVTNWWDRWAQHGCESYPNGKREGFSPFLALPSLTPEPLELAVCLGDDDLEEKERLQQQGWRLRDPGKVAGTPWDYQRYIQRSRAEWSCVKPSCVKLQNAWISDRTLCYLASGKPAVVQHTGPSQFLPDAAGLFRFRTIDEAVRSLEAVTSDYERQCNLARALAEEHFDARRGLKRVLETALA
jgi:hypothetical protein